MKHLFLTVFLVGILLSVRAQTITVRDKHSFAPVSDVFIVDTRHRHSVVSDEHGQAVIDSFDAKDSLIFQHQSYQWSVLRKQDIILNYKLVLLAPRVISINPYEVVAYKDKQDAIKTLPFQLTIISPQEVRQSLAANGADLLEASGDVMVQRSQAGGGSPVLQGFEANKVLLVVDGIRMNNIIYRSGHLQNSVTVDPAMLEKTELLFGPGGVMYGSDALGGVVAYVTKNPMVTGSDTSQYRVTTFARFNSANTSFITHADVNSGFKKWGTFTGITNSEFGDVVSGRNRKSIYGDLGLVKNIAVNTLRGDTQIVNPDPVVQLGTAYRQIDFMQKVRYKPSEHADMVLNVQYSTSSNINRFDKLNDYKDTLLKYALWYYGPQTRLLTALHLNLTHEESKFCKEAHITTAFQDVEESRITRKFGKDEEIHRIESVRIGSFNADFLTQLNRYRIQYGGELLYNEALSNAYSLNTNTMIHSASATRYPDGGSTMYGAAAYLNFKRKIATKIYLNTGTRFNFNRFESRFVDTVFYPFPFNRISISGNALTWAFGFVVHPNDKWVINAAVSSGYRSPNVDDYGKVFSKSDYVMVPNDQLQPEYVYHGETGVVRELFTGRVSLSGMWYYTILQEVIQRQSFTLLDKDSMMYDGDYLPIRANVNSGSAFITGGTAKLAIKAGVHWKAGYTMTYTYGRNISNDTPMGHIPPLYGKVSLTYTHRSLKISAYSYFNGNKPIALYSQGGEDNEDEALPVGTPPWYTLNINAELFLFQDISLQFGATNIMDVYYKPFASGISAPGRSFFIALKAAI